MKIGDNVMVSPLFSMRFAGRWGIIKQVKEDNGLPYKLDFGTPILYGFSNSELITEDTYLRSLLDAEIVKTRQGKQVRIKDASDKPNIITDSGSHLLYDLLPVTYCTSCGKDTTGTIHDMCEDCYYQP